MGTKGKKNLVDAADAGMRLDAYLAKTIGGQSRTVCQRAIKRGEVLLNGKKTVPHAKLREGDAIVMVAAAPPAAIGRPAGPDLPVEIIYDDADIVVVNKPSGMLAHPAVAADQGALTHVLSNRYPQIAVVGESPLRPGIVHRLDKDASGLMVVAKTPAAYDSLKRQFQSHKIKKIYSVLVHGRPPSQHGSIAFPIARARRGGKMAACPDGTPGARDAVTHYRITEAFPQATLVEARTETGRTHQVRAHFKAIGCPIVGDPLYGRRKLKPLPANRLFLHASTLGFTHPTTGKNMEFHAPLPKELRQTLDVLRKSA